MIGVLLMKTSQAEFDEKKITLADVIANQHPVINSWIMLSAIAIVVLYAITLSSI